MTAVFTLCAAYVAYCLLTNPAGPATSPDSFHYLNTSPIVPLGYPFFLKLVGARGAMLVQPLLFGGALAFLGSEIVRLTRSTLLAVLVVIGCMALPQIREFHASILSESLFLSCLVVFLGFAVRFAYHPTWHLMVLVATTAGVASTVRRTAFALVPVMLAMVLLERHRLRGSQSALFFVAALAPFLVVIGAEQAAAPVVHAGKSSSLMGRHMFAKAALLEAPPAPPTTDHVRTALDQHLESDYAPIRAFLSSAPRDIRGVLSMYYETCLQGGCADRSRALMTGLDESVQTDTLGQAAMARIRRAPAAFLDLLVMNYQALWTIDRLRHPDRAPALAAFVASHRPMPFEREAFSLEPGQTMDFPSSPRVRYAQIAISALAIWTGALAVLGLAGIFFAPRVPRLLVIAGVAALAAHGGLMLTASLAAGFSRFTLGLWPAIVTAAAFGLAAIAPFRFTRP
ncbi:MAG TPA: hypothetical protein VNT81_05410 [Vicinamibacterales bacterium]|nr:hypothetical protein [Vicinamibacterales bacterium]